MVILIFLPWEFFGLILGYVGLIINLPPPLTTTPFGSAIGHLPRNVSTYFRVAQH
jgi:hypothetical protein